MPTENGLRGAIRRLTASDRQLHTEHLLRLDGEGRRNRFNGIVNDTMIERYSLRCFGSPTTVIAYVENGRVLGTAEMHRPTHGEPADTAFSVEAPLRRRGVGSTLFEAMIEEARATGVPVIRITCSTDNQAMRALARKYGTTFSFDHGEATGTLIVAHAPSQRDSSRRLVAGPLPAAVVATR